METSFSVKGMKCVGCEKILADGIGESGGVLYTKADFSSASLLVSFDESKTDVDRIKQTARNLGYSLNDSAGCEKVCEGGRKSAFGKFGDFALALALLALFAFAYLVVSHFFGGIALPAPGSTTALASVFAVGLFTGLHCIGMCGGFMASSSKSGKRGISFYLAGKLISYTAIGALLGLLGSAVMISSEIRSALAILAGLFMAVFGLSALGLGSFRKIYSSVPKFRLPISYSSGGPFILGLLNGFMPCGPLLAMQLYALSTGSPIAGALALFFFGAGTIPFMAGFGAILSSLAASSKTILSKASSVAVILLGISLLWNGMAPFLPDISTAQSGSQAYVSASQASPRAELQASSQNISNAPQDSSGSSEVQTLRISVSGAGYEPSVLQAKPNTKTRLILDAKELTGCNRQFQIPAFGILINLKKGENTVEFTTGPEGSSIDFACGMNMLRGQILVANDSQVAGQAAVKSAPAPKKSGCGCEG